MQKHRPVIVICVIIVTTVSALCICIKTLTSVLNCVDLREEICSIVNAIINILSYATVFLPGYLIYKYLHKINYFNKAGPSGLTGGLIRTCFGGDDEIPLTAPTSGPSTIQRSQCHNVLLFLFYFFGLQLSYLSWGLLQEKVMTQKYVKADGTDTYFRDSQFLVFINRVLAFLMSGIYLFFEKQPRHRCPLYKYGFCSFSNIMSSWCQYEALKYISFPHQVLAKACKTIPVMVMGKILFRTKYEYKEYLTAVILSLGMLIFLMNTGNDRTKEHDTTLIGAILLAAYLTFDSFTSNWQEGLFKTYHVRPVQMMCSVNLFSMVFTAVSLLQQGTFAHSLSFMFQCPSFILDCILLSICSAGGQLFIFNTIATFGPVVFAMISTVRQALSVLLSCIIYHHEVNAKGVAGILLIFAGLFMHLYVRHQIRKSRKKQILSDIKL